MAGAFENQAGESGMTLSIADLQPTAAQAPSVQLHRRLTLDRNPRRRFRCSLESHHNGAAE